MVVVGGGCRGPRSTSLHQTIQNLYLLNTTRLFFFNRISNFFHSTVTHYHPLSLLHPSPSITQIKQAHAHLIVLGQAAHSAIAGRLLAVCALSPSSSPEYFCAIFNQIENPNLFSMNNMIRCYAKSLTPQESIVFYADMCRKNVIPNNYTFPFVLQACSKTPAINDGVQIHAHIMKLGFVGDLYVCNALIHFYSAFREMEDSRQIFEESARRDVVSWNAIIAGYAKDGRIDVSEKLFEEMPQRDVISWSTMIMGYVQSGHLEKGLEFFRRMREEGFITNEATLVTVLSATAQLGLLERGRLLHSTIKALNVPITVALGTALVDMYAKCGCIELSQKLFEEMPQRDVPTWNAMICGLATHGLGSEALSLFSRFTDEGLRPVNVTFVGVLNACSRTGLVDEGWFYFKSMIEDYSIEPEMEHYGCMIDLLGRAGYVAKALELIRKMPVAPDPVIWGTLLGACKIHGLADLGETIGKKLIEMEPTHDGNYVLLANIYARTSKWEDVIKVRTLMVNRGTNKVAGWSLIEAQGRVHRFVAGDRTHEQSTKIYKVLRVVEKRLSEEGYSPDISPVLHDIGEEEKEHAIRVHSERLAIAFGLMVCEIGGLIRIVKNLRVCGDCHVVSKIISKVFEREIIVRDGSRFHHFKQGKCSCLDYW